MNDEKRHQEIRGVLRSLGPIILVAGVLLTAIGMISFFGAFNSGEPPTMFWCAFLGLPLLALGGSLVGYGYMGEVSRYVASEKTPVVKDVVNYLSDETQDSVRKVSQAVGEGLAKSVPAAGTITWRRCHKCNHDNALEAKYCSNCGAALAKSKVCPRCNELNDPDAKFCDNCGTAFEA